MSVTRLEQLSIRALIAYAAHEVKRDVTLVSEILLADFNATSVEALSRDDFDNVVRYLVDLDFKKVIN